MEEMVMRRTKNVNFNSRFIIGCLGDLVERRIINEGTKKRRVPNSNVARKQLNARIIIRWNELAAHILNRSVCRNDAVIHVASIDSQIYTFCPYGATKQHHVENYGVVNAP